MLAIVKKVVEIYVLIDIRIENIFILLKWPIMSSA